MKEAQIREMVDLWLEYTRKGRGIEEMLHNLGVVLAEFKDEGRRWIWLDRSMGEEPYYVSDSIDK